MNVVAEGAAGHRDIRANLGQRPHVILLYAFGTLPGRRAFATDIQRPRGRKCCSVSKRGAGARETERLTAANINAAGLAKELDALRRLTVKKLRRRHVELFGEETRAGNR